MRSYPPHKCISPPHIPAQRSRDPIAEDPEIQTWTSPKSLKLRNSRIPRIKNNRKTQTKNSKLLLTTRSTIHSAVECRSRASSRSHDPNPQTRQWIRVGVQDLGSLHPKRHAKARRCACQSRPYIPVLCVPRADAIPPAAHFDKR